MNKRIISIIQFLTGTGENICIADIADQFQVSQRTVRNDLKTINDLLTEHGLAPLTLGKGGRILLEPDFQAILTYIEEKDFYDYKLSREERKKIASVLLVTATDYVTLGDLAEYMAVSRATVIHDLDEVKAYIASGNLHVSSHPNKGLLVEGKESDKRIFLLGLVNYNPQASSEDVVQKQIAAAEDKSEILGKILYEQEHAHECFLSDASFQKIHAYLKIMAKRMELGCYVEPRKITQNSKTQMAADILKYAGQYLQLEITKSEIQLFSELLTFGRYMKQKSSDPDSVKIQVAARQFIEAISGELGIHLTDDYDFFENLSRHLESTAGLQVQMPESNSVIETVLQENPRILQAVKNNLSVLEPVYNRLPDESETGYIAVHVCAAIERRKNQETSFRLIVACHAGIGTSQLLMEKLKKHFHFQIADIVSSHEAGNLKEGQADLVVSTVSLKNCPIPWIQVSPLLKDEDYIRIGNLVEELRSKAIFRQPVREGQNEKSAENLISDLAKLLYEKVPEEAGSLIPQVEKIVDHYFTRTQEKDPYSPGISQLLPATHIQLDVSCATWQEAIQASARKLLELDYIEPRYVEAMIRNVEENGPYIVLVKGFAVPHEGIDKGVKKTGMNLIRLKEPVNFHAEENDPVEFVCCMSAADHQTHLKAFFHLVNLLRNQEFLSDLKKCSTPEEAAQRIRYYEEKSDKEGRS